MKNPYYIFTNRVKHLRAKTIRIGKIRWPPPLNPNAEQYRSNFLYYSIQIKAIVYFLRQIFAQRRIHEEIKTLSPMFVLKRNIFLFCLSIN
jgi:hypothetical protein